MTSSRQCRIAVGSLFIECNHLGGVPTEIECFERCELWRGSQVISRSTGAVAGMLGTLDECGAECVPLIVATACPSGPLTEECYSELKREMLDRLHRALPVDGVLLALHGAAAADGIGDLDGDLLISLRAMIGDRIPVVVTLDLHAHVTEAMVHNTDALLAWETYPHRDTFQTGQRGARMLLEILGGRCRPTMALAKVPVLVGSVHGNTEGSGPFAELMRHAKSLERQPGVLSTSVLHAYPYLDLPNIGSGGLVITDNEPRLAAVHAANIAHLYWEKRFEMEPDVYSPADAIRRGISVGEGPVLLVEAADCCGGGAAGDSVATLKALLQAGHDVSALVPVVDPAAAALCHARSLGQRVNLSLGHGLDPRWGSPLTIDAEIRNLTDGHFTYSGGIWEGQRGDMGKTAVLSVGPIEILVASRATYEWADEQYTSAGLHAERARFVVVKNPMNYRNGFAGLAKATLILDTPGPTPATLRAVKYQNVRRPYFPLDEQIENLVPELIQSKRR